VGRAGAGAVGRRGGGVGSGTSLECQQQEGTRRILVHAFHKLFMPLLK